MGSNQESIQFATPAFVPLARRRPSLTTSQATPINSSFAQINDSVFLTDQKTLQINNQESHLQLGDVASPQSELLLDQSNAGNPYSVPAAPHRNFDRDELRQVGHLLESFRRRYSELHCQHVQAIQDLTCTQSLLSQSDENLSRERHAVESAQRLCTGLQKIISSLSQKHPYFQLL